jgi:hypothetical protein
MNVVCLCPTYGRPRLVQNVLSCFMSQTYPADRMRLFLYDDLGSFLPCSASDFHNVMLWMTTVRAPSLPSKYNQMLDELAKDGEMPDVLINMDDDDVYLPDYVARHVAAIEAGAAWSHHPHAIVECGTKFDATNPQPMRKDGASGRFHGSLAARWDLVDALGGWIETDRASFDLEFIKRLRDYAGPPGVPEGEPQYIFRWTTTGAPHAQHKMGDRTGWYRKIPVADDRQVQLKPVYDLPTQVYYRMYADATPYGEPA